MSRQRAFSRSILRLLGSIALLALCAGLTGAASGDISTVAGNGSAGFSGDGGPATSAQINVPQAMAVDLNGDFYITGSYRVRKVTAATGNISTVAGTGVAGFSGDGGPATSAQLSGPSSVATDASGNLYISDLSNQRIRKVDAATGIISTVAGTGGAGFSGDGGPATSAFDAALTLLDVLSSGTLLSGLERLAANVDIDPVGSGINPFDASLILQHRVGLITTFPVQDAGSSNHPQPNPGSPKLVPQQLALALHAGEGYLSVWAEERDQIVSGDLLLAGVDGRVAMGDDLSDFLSASQSTEEGLRIVFAGAEGVLGAGELLRVYPGVGSDRASLVRALFNNGDLEGQASGLVGASSRPVSFALHANMPNPFNPETSIGFDLAQAGWVQLEIFDALGQKVQTLVSGQRSAGVHQVLWRGVDERGQRVSSGVYFYRLQTGDYRQMRRMLLLK